MQGTSRNLQLVDRLDCCFALCFGLSLLVHSLLRFMLSYFVALGQRKSIYISRLLRALGRVRWFVTPNKLSWVWRLYTAARCFGIVEIVACGLVSFRAAFCFSGAEVVGRTALDTAKSVLFCWSCRCDGCVDAWFTRYLPFVCPS